MIDSLWGESTGNQFFSHVMWSSQLDLVKETQFPWRSSASRPIGTQSSKESYEYTRTTEYLDNRQKYHGCQGYMLNYHSTRFVDHVAVFEQQMVGNHIVAWVHE